MKVTVNTKEFDELAARVKDAHKQLRPPMQSAMKLLKSDTQKQPPRQPGLFAATATPKQKRYVFALIRRGEWTGRTGKSAAAWRYVTDVLSNKLRGVLSNELPQSVYIFGERQQPFLVNWPQVKKVFENRKRHIEGLFNSAIEKLAK